MLGLRVYDSMREDQGLGEDIRTWITALKHDKEVCSPIMGSWLVTLHRSTSRQCWLGTMQLSVCCVMSTVARDDAWD